MEDKKESKGNNNNEKCILADTSDLEKLDPKIGDALLANSDVKILLKD